MMDEVIDCVHYAQRQQSRSLRFSSTLQTLCAERQLSVTPFGMTYLVDHTGYSFSDLEVLTPATGVQSSASRTRR